MSKSTTFQEELLDLIFLNTAVAGIGDSSGLQPSAAAGSLYIALHTADPGEAGVQTTSEATFTSYARVAVARAAGGWTRSGNNVSNTAQIAFPQATGGSNDIKFFTVGQDSTGGGDVLYYGHLGEAAMPFNGAATGNLLTVVDHTLVDDDEVFIFEAPGATLPTGLTRGLYFVITPSGDDFTVESTIGGGAVSISADGAGYIAKVVPKTIANGDTFTFEIGDLDINEN